MDKTIIIFESLGGSDKWLDGHRKDTQPIIYEISKLPGYASQVIIYKKESEDKILNYIKDNNVVAYISRVNPSRDFDEKSYFEFLRKLISQGIEGLPHPDDMLNMGAKDSLAKLATESAVITLVDADTKVYYTQEELEENFPKTLSRNTRVLKQNRGSTGEGIWRVTPKNSIEGVDSEIICTEAVDNHTEENKLGEFMKFCSKYLEGDNGMLVDMLYLDRITEGELRVLMIGNKPVLLVHKKPTGEGDAFSATLFSGATYTPYEVDDLKYAELISTFKEQLPAILKKLNVNNVPLIWTADFIPVFKNNVDTWSLSELNCSCVGFTTNLELASVVAEAAVAQIEGR